MKVEETRDKNCCDECGEYDYAFEIRVRSGRDEDEKKDYALLTLCKPCLLKLLKAIVER